MTFLLALIVLTSPSAFASPWAEKPGYFPKVFGKLEFGLKNSLLSWTEMFIQPTQPKYKTDWEGFCVGMAAAVIETGNGLIHLVTFPIPVDVPDLGRGVHIPERVIDRSMEHPKLEAAMDKAVTKVAGKPQKASPATAPSPAETVPVPATISAETTETQAVLPTAQTAPSPLAQENAPSQTAPQGSALPNPAPAAASSPAPSPSEIPQVPQS